MKPTLLFISPVSPSPTGNGLAMRAHAFLRALSAQNRVCLLVANHPPPDAQTRSLVQSLCEEVVYRPVGLWKGRQLARRAACLVPAVGRRVFPQPYEWATVARVALHNPFAVREFDGVHVFRMYTIPLLDVLRDSANWQQMQLDVDDVESLTRQRLSSLHDRAGHFASAAQLALEAQQYMELERNRFHDFGRVFVCSEADRQWALQGGLHPAPEVVPNVVCVPDTVLPEPDDAEFRFLFIGALGYYPNADAVQHFCLRVLPVIQACVDRPVRMDIAGAGMSRRLARCLSRCPGVRLLGFVPHVADAYRSAHAVIVPVRGGGGTRIKVLEAFAYGRCVVATPQAIDGIELEAGKHAVLGEDVEGLAMACIKVIGDASLRQRVARDALRLVRSRYSPKALAACLVAPRPFSIGVHLTN